MNATNLQPSLLDKRSAIASGIQAQARRWLAGGSKRYLRAREEICKTNFGIVQIYHQNKYNCTMQVPLHSLVLD